VGRYVHIQWRGKAGQAGGAAGVLEHVSRDQHGFLWAHMDWGYAIRLDLPGLTIEETDSPPPGWEL
jgi:hypothetical protein